MSKRDRHTRRVLAYAYAAIVSALTLWPVTSAHAYIGTWQWGNTVIFGGGDAAALDVALDSQGNVIAAGYNNDSDPLLHRSAYVYKYRPSGSIIWSRHVEQGPYDPSLSGTQGFGKHSSDDTYTSVTVDGEDNVILGGTISGVWNGYVDGSYHTGAHLQKFSADGTELWSRIFQDTSGSAWQAFNGVAAGPDGAVYATGAGFGQWGGAEHRWVTLKFTPEGGDALGPIFYDYAHSIYLSDYSFDVALDSEGNMIVAGRRGVSGTDGGAANDFDWVVRKYDPAGNLLWEDVRDANLLFDSAYAVSVMPNDDILVGGYLNHGTDNQDNADYNWLVVCYASDGSEIKAWEYGGTGARRNDSCLEIVGMADNTFYAGGTLTDDTLTTTGWIIHVDTITGEIVDEELFPQLASVRGIAVRGNSLALAGIKAGETTSFFTALYDISLIPGEGEGEGECDAVCATNADTDGDGLDDCFECQSGYDWNSPDTDGDGMDDHFEFRYGLDPLAFDADGDKDGDGLTNLDEYLRHSEPDNAASPATVYFVSPSGDDIEGDGTISNPWETIGKALDFASPTESNPVRINALFGTYVEDVSLNSYMTLAGDIEDSTQIQGTIQGAAHSRLENLEVMGPDHAAQTLLTIDNVPMSIEQVVFRGTITRAATGIRTLGAASGGTVITRCSFTSLSTGLHISGALPTVRRSTFQDVSRAGILVDGAAKQSTATLGDATNPATGWNIFRVSGAGVLAVENNSASELKLENNDWGVDTPAAIDALIGGTGAADFQPFLATGSAILAGSLFCTVQDAITQAPVLDASITLQPSGYAPVTDNEVGVYAYPAVPPDSYTVQASAPGHTTSMRTVTIGNNALVSLVMPLQPGAAEGEGEGEGEKPGPGCTAEGAGAALPLGGDVALIAGLCLLLAVRMRRRRA